MPFVLLKLYILYFITELSCLCTLNSATRSLLCHFQAEEARLHALDDALDDVKDDAMRPSSPDASHASIDAYFTERDESNKVQDCLSVKSDCRMEFYKRR